MQEPTWSTADPAREDVLTRTFVQLADSLVEGFDIIDLLTALVDSCVELLHAVASEIVRGALPIEIVAGASPRRPTD